MNKLYPSAVAPVFGHTTNSYKESCPRFYAMSIAVGLPRTEIDDLYKAVGRIVEDKVRAELIANKPANVELSMEVPVKYEIAPRWVISGRVDVLMHDSSDARNNQVWEIKSVISNTKKRSVIDAGQIDVKNVGQLITYMAILRIPRGVLSYTYAHFSPGLTELQFQSRNFSVDIEGQEIYVDGKRWPAHAVSDYLRFYSLMMDSVDKIDLPAMTLNARACSACPFNITCETQPQSKEEFKATFQYIGEGHVKAMPTPKISVCNSRKRT